MNIGSMATYPARRDSLKETLRSILPQLNQIYIYCNQYQQAHLEELNNWLSVYSHGCKVKLIDGASFKGDLKDMGKFWSLNEVDGYVFLLDDDIIYPSDYVYRHTRAIELHQCITSVHGRIIRRTPMQDYYSDTKSFHYRQPLKGPTIVDIAGTGTVAFSPEFLPDSFHFHPGSQDMQKFQGRADIWFGCQARIHSLQIKALSRGKEWLTDTPSSKGLHSLYDEASKDTTEICRILNQIDWS